MGIEKKYVRNSFKGVKTLITFVHFTCDFFPPVNSMNLVFCAPREEPMFQQRPYLILCFGTKSSVLLAFNECLLIVPCLWEALGSMWSLHVLCTCKITGWICSIYNTRLTHGGFQRSFRSVLTLWSAQSLNSDLSSNVSIHICVLVSWRGSWESQTAPKVWRYSFLLSKTNPSCQSLVWHCTHGGKGHWQARNTDLRCKQTKLGTVTQSWRRAALPSRGEKQSRCPSHPFWGRYSLAQRAQAGHLPLAKRVTWF